MNIEKTVFNVLLTGILAAIAWVLFWAFFVPEILPALTWSGHGSLIVPVFVVGCVGGVVGEALASN